MISVDNTPIIQAQVLTQMPNADRRRGGSRWAIANGFGETIDCFLEGPSFDAAGNLYVVDIPYGRIFKINPALKWECIFEDDGWPNGLAMATDGFLWIADYRKGIRRLKLVSGRIETILGEHNSESFKGVNDLIFDRSGNLLFTDQGQTGLQDPTGRVYELAPSGRLTLLLSNGPSPNGLAIDSKNTLYVAMTRANQIWRGPVQADGTWTKVCAFQTFYGVAGPDGLALDPYGRLLVAHPGLGCLFVLNVDGEVTHMVRSPAEHALITNVALTDVRGDVVMTDSRNGVILAATIPPPDASMTQ